MAVNVLILIILMELFTSTGKLFFFFFGKVTRVWQQLEYRIDVCRVTLSVHVKNF